MSGGHFDYNQQKIGGIADEIEMFIQNNDIEDGDTGIFIGLRYSPETLDEFRNAIRALKIARVYAQRVDWLVSDDDSEDTFHARLAIDLAELDR